MLRPTQILLQNQRILLAKIQNTTFFFCFTLKIPFHVSKPILSTDYL